MTMPEVAGPPCDMCGEYPAIVSLMNLADYSQSKLCGMCAPGLFRSIADTMDGGAQPDASGPGGDQPAGLEPETPDEAPGSQPDGPDDDDEPGSARDHWASTTNVRRSTHGHRRPRAAAEKPESGEPA